MVLPAGTGRTRRRAGRTDARDPGHDEHRERPSPAPRERHALGDDQHQRGPERVELAAVGQHRRDVDQAQGQRQREVLDPRRQRGGPGPQPRHDLAVHDLIVWRRGPGGSSRRWSRAAPSPGGGSPSPRRGSAALRSGGNRPAARCRPAAPGPTMMACRRTRSREAHSRSRPQLTRGRIPHQKPPACWPAPAARPGWASSSSPRWRSRSRWR